MNDNRFNTEDRIITMAIEALENHLGLGWKTTFTPYEKQRLFTGIEIIIKRSMVTGLTEVYKAVAMVQKEFRDKHLIKLLDKLRREDRETKVIVLAEKIFPKVRAFLKERDIDYLDTAGNCKIKNENIFLDIEGKKVDEIYREGTNRAFTKTGLKVTYCFLQNPKLLNEPYRTIAEEAGVAFGAIKLILNGLEEAGYLLKKAEGYELTRIGDLYDRWVIAFGDRLKPNLAIGRYRFLNPNDFIHWKELKLQQGKTWWGGEPAGALYTNYLKPEELTLYTAEKRNDLMKNYKLIPDPDGDVVVYQKFWKEKNDHDNKVTPLIAYADLMFNKEPRCYEIAHKIYEQYLEKNL